VLKRCIILGVVVVFAGAGCFPPLPAEDEDIDVNDTSAVDDTTDPVDTTAADDTLVPDAAEEDTGAGDTSPPEDTSQDTLVPLDTVTPEDTAAPVDTVEPDDTATPVDTVEPQDTSVPEDTVEPTDTATPQDTVEPVDTVTPQDTVEPVDTVTPQDTSEPVDTVIAEDTVPPQDTVQDTTVVLTCPGGCVASTTPCKVSQCDTSTGTCVEVDADNGSTCDDGLVCTIGDKCLDGECLSTQNPCDDGIACTADSCDEGLGGCINDDQGCDCAPGRPCGDGEPCNGVETCDLSTYTCTPGTALDDDTPCDDGLVCTVDDSCQGGACTSTTRDCSDELPCSADSCSEELGGCVNDTSACTCTSDDDCPDGNLCDGTAFCDFDADACDPGTPVICQTPANACERATCVPQTGACAIVDREDGTECDDNDVCTTTDTCLDGTCTGTSPVTCTPSNVCQLSLGCDPVHGCLEVPREDGTPCDTPNDEQGSCQSGTCKRLPIVVAGDTHTCAILSDGGLKCWGYSCCGQLGHGNSSDPRPIRDKPPVLADVRSVAGWGNNTCAVRTNGYAYCWGENPVGNLGYGDLMNRGDTPETIPSQLSPIDVGAFSTNIFMAPACVTVNSNGLRCWGPGPLLGAEVLGISDVGTPDGPSPSEVGDIAIDYIAHVKRIAYTAQAKCALLDNHKIRCWGLYYANGASHKDTLGDDEALPDIPVINPTWDAIALDGDGGFGDSHFCAVSSSGELFCWGSNDQHQLGNSTETVFGQPRPPQLINTPVAFRDVAAGEFFTCGLTTSDGVRCWGDSSHGECGQGSTSNVSSVPGTDIELGGPVATLSCGPQHCCAVLRNGEAKCWGYNSSGQLGIDRYIPTQDTWTSDTNNRGDDPGEMPPPSVVLE